MKFSSFVVSAAVMLLSTAALSQDNTDVAPMGPAPSTVPPPPSASAPPVTVAPQDTPPSVNLPAPAVAPGTLPPGQWVSTAQYGWVWMPYDQAYTSAPVESGGDPYAYMYSPVYGWRWLAAPWVFGIGPQPYFGVYGYAHFGWYGHGWYGHPWYGYRGGYPREYRGVVRVHPGGYYGAHVVNTPQHMHGSTQGRVNQPRSNAQGRVSQPHSNTPGRVNQPHGNTQGHANQPHGNTQGRVSQPHNHTQGHGNEHH